MKRMIRSVLLVLLFPGVYGNAAAQALNASHHHQAAPYLAKLEVMPRITPEAPDTTQRSINTSKLEIKSRISPESAPPASPQNRAEPDHGANGAVNAGNTEPPPPLRVLDISERTFDNGPSIAVVLSEALDPTVRHDEHIRISDPKEMLRSAWILSEDGRTLYFPHVEPETQYSVTVMESLTAQNGAKPADRVSTTVTTRKVTPIVSFASEGFILPSKLTQGLPVVTINVPAVDIEFFRLNRNGLLKFVSWRDTTKQESYYQLSQMKEYGELAYSGRFQLDAPRNRRTVLHVPVEGIKALREPGVYLAVMRQPGEYEYQYQTTYFTVTDIGLHARAYPKKSVIVTSSLKTGGPLADVKLALYNNDGKVLERCTTGPDGVCDIGRTLPDGATILLAEHKDQFGILPLTIPALDLSEFELGSRKFREREIFLYSPRDLYRPGETVILSALFRDYDGRPVPSRPLKVKLLRPDGREVKTFTWQPEALSAPDLNYYQRSIPIPANGQTGKWRVQVFDDPADNNPAAEYTLQVEDFLPERMKLDLTVSPEAPMMDEAVKVDVSGQYLYGAPASGNNVKARVILRADRTHLKNQFDAMKGFEFGNADDAEYRDYWEMEEQKLDNSGTATLEIENRWQSIQSPLSLRVVVDLFETGGRPVTRLAKATLWPAPTLIGIRPLFDDKSSDEGTVRFEVVKTNRNGEMLPAEGLNVDLIKEDRDYYWEYSESTGWQYKYNEKIYTFQSDSLTLKAGEPTEYAALLRRGSYKLAITDRETGITTSKRFHVGRYWWHDDDGGSARPDKVVMTLDKPAYRAGDIARVTVTPPHAGEGLILVEGQSSVWMKRMPISGEGTTVEIPIRADWNSHDLHISAVVFRPADAEEKITPNRTVGLIHLPLDRSRRKLDIAINAPDKVRPQEPMTVTLTSEAAANGDGPVFVTVAAVDVGILNITDFETPDPHTFFFERRRYAVNAYDAYGKVIENYDGGMAKLRFGGDADLTAGKKPESEVKLLSLFQGPVRFGADGTAQVTFDLPDFNGAVRLMAVAFDKERFGSAEKEVIVAAPVVTQLAMPRFLAPGDTSVFTLDVHNLSGQDQSLRLTMRTEGTVDLTEGERNIDLKDGEKTTLRFPVTATGAFGKGKIYLELAGSDFKQRRDWTIGVRPGWPAISEKAFSVVQPGESYTLDPALVKGLIPETVVADLKISPTLSLNFRDAMRGLIGYPYGCLEQTTSRSYPLLFATPANIERYNLPEITRDERQKRLDGAINKLMTMQLASGGFGLWHTTGPEEGWLTAYATEFLFRADEMGIEVPEGMIDKAMKRLESYLKQDVPMPEYMENKGRDHLRFAVQSYAAYVLSLPKRAPLGTLRTIYDNHHGAANTGMPLAHMGVALKRMGDIRRANDALKKAVEKRTKEEDGWWGDYGSPVRDLAMTAALLVESDADNIDGFDALLLDLETAVRERRWLSTQERFAIFHAGILLNQRSGKPWKGRLAMPGQEVVVDGKQVVMEQIIDRKTPHIESLTPRAIENGVIFTSESTERLFVSAVVNGYTMTPPEKDDSQIALSREMFDLNGKPVTRREFKVGELLLVHLSVTAKQYIPDALIVDLIPAGFEIENQNLKHGFKMEDMSIAGESIWKLRERAPIVHEEFRDDRYAAAARLSDQRIVHFFYLVRVVSPGSFSVPPVFAESMYRPEIRGIGATPERITVVNESQ